MQIRELLRILTDDGWYEVRQKGSHKQFKHSVKKGLVLFLIINCQMIYPEAHWQAFINKHK